MFGEFSRECRSVHGSHHPSPFEIFEFVSVRKKLSCLCEEKAFILWNALSNPSGRMLHEVYVFVSFANWSLKYVFFWSSIDLWPGVPFLSSWCLRIKFSFWCLCGLGLVLGYLNETSWKWTQHVKARWPCCKWMEDIGELLLKWVY